MRNSDNSEALLLQIADLKKEIIGLQKARDSLFTYCEMLERKDPTLELIVCDAFAIRYKGDPEQLVTYIKAADIKSYLDIGFEIYDGLRRNYLSSSLIKDLIEMQESNL